MLNKELRNLVDLLRCTLVPAVLFASGTVYADNSNKVDWGEGRTEWIVAPPNVKEQNSSSRLWQVSLGIGTVFAPKYEGANKYEASAVPLVDIVFMDRLFLSSTQGAGVYLFSGSDFNIGAAANYVGARKEKDSDRLKGLGDIDGYVDVGAFVQWTPGPFNLSLEGFQGTNGAKGTHITASAGHTMILFNKLQIAHELSTTYADSRYNNQFFGITREQSNNSARGYEEYHAGKGIKDVAFSATVSYDITEDISASFIAGYKRLVGPAAKSPLVKDGSKNQGLVGVGIAYRF